MRKAQNRADEPAWRIFEKEVARIRGLFSPNAIITHDEILVDRFGNKRQFDVTIKDNWAGESMLAVVECKNLSRPVNVEQVDSFANKKNNILANVGIIVSKMGFTSGALKLAKKEGIGTHSLLPKETEKDIPFAIGHYAFATLYRWEELQIRVTFSSKKVHSTSLNIKFNNTYIVDWFRNEINNIHHTEKFEGWIIYDFQFKRPVKFELDGELIPVSRVAICARRKMSVKTKFLQCEGDAIYDWQRNAWVLPPNGWLSFGIIDTYKIEDWDDAESGNLEDNKSGVIINLYGYHAMESANPAFDYSSRFMPSVSIKQTLDEYFI